jgi:hypothetical protein
LNAAASHAGAVGSFSSALTSPAQNRTIAAIKQHRIGLRM